MSCWVVPSVAAELWGVAVDIILAKARSGELPSKTDNGFLFIDVAPDNEHGCRVPKELRPPTFTALTSDELSALHAPEPELPAQPQVIDDWRVGRRLAMQNRRAPKSDAA